VIRAHNPSRNATGLVVGWIDPGEMANPARHGSRIRNLGDVEHRKGACVRLHAGTLLVLWQVVITCLELLPEHDGRRSFALANLAPTAAHWR